jgi:hypothetical protein
MMTHRPRRPHDDDRYNDQDDYQPSRRSKKKPSLLNQIPMDWLLTIGSVGIIFEAVRATSVVSYLLVAAWIALSAIVLVYTDKATASFESNYRRFAKKYGRTGILGILFGAFALTSMFLLFAEPSQAFFLTTAEQAFKKVFSTAASATTTATGNSSDNATPIAAMISLVFGLIRILLLIAVIFGVVKAIQARDDQEQVKAQLMLPIIIIVGVIVIDVMTGLIFGSELGASVNP